MKHLGDITKINGAEIEVVDVITGGSPCQDLSIAGKRAGLAGARSGLFMEQVRIVKEMREHDRASGRTGDMVRPRFMVWENVPGAFSSNKGQDFAAVLEEIIRIAEPEAPDIEVPEKGWNTWGGYHDEVGGRWSVAWRVHDAQHWGVPQRRRRISVVADFGGDTAGEILFERKSVSRNLAESGAARERLAGNAENGASYAVRIRGGCDGGGKGALVQKDKSGTLGTGNDQTIFTSMAYSFDSLASNSMKSKNPHSGCRKVEIAKTLDTTYPDPSKNQGGICVLDMSHACDVIRDCGEVAPSLQARMGTGGNQCREDMAAYIASVDCRNFCEGEETNGTLQAKESGGQSLNLQNTVRVGMIVRRLTPMECERLQGFPDYWTDIGEWRDSKGKLRKPSDSPRYKACGNSIALPFWDFLAKRISAQYLRPVTMGSLFDGIGGFPLVFERHNGKGTARWASEIEEFPIAVTKLRFGEG